MRFMLLSGISYRFQQLSPSMRQVLYVLLTRSPLSFSSASTRKTSLDLHVLGTPPAFVLSQDQTLQINCQLDQLIKKFYSSFLELSFFGINVDLIRLVFNVQVCCDQQLLQFNIFIIRCQELFKSFFKKIFNIRFLKNVILAFSPEDFLYSIISFILCQEFLVTFFSFFLNIITPYFP